MRIADSFSPGISECEQVKIGILKRERVNLTHIHKRLTLPLLRLLSSKAQGRKDYFENHLNPVMLVFIGYLLLSTLG